MPIPHICHAKAPAHVVLERRMLRGRTEVHPRMTGIPHGRSRSSLISTRVALASLRIRDVSRLARPTEVATMHTTDMAAMLLERLLQRYGPLLTTEDIATELRVRRDVIYNRRSRGSTRGIPLIPSVLYDNLSYKVAVFVL